MTSLLHQQSGGDSKECQSLKCLRKLPGQVPQCFTWNLPRVSGERHCVHPTDEIQGPTGGSQVTATAVLGDKTLRGVDLNGSTEDRTTRVPFLTGRPACRAFRAGARSCRLAPTSTPALCPVALPQPTLRLVEGDEGDGSACERWTGWNEDLRCHR